MRIGLDNMYGYISEVNDLGLELETEAIIDLEEFKSYIGNPDAQIVDVRGLAEYQSYHVDGADHVFVGTLTDNLEKFNKEKQFVNPLPKW
jgi:hydroxyacylglutathione hydrolase